MPLVNITWKKGHDRSTKDKVRADICNEIAGLIGFDPKFVAVLFSDIEEDDICSDQSFAEIYLSEGRPIEFKEKLVLKVTKSICRYTGLPLSSVAVIIHDIRMGSVAVSGKVANRGKTAAETVSKGEV